MKKVLALISATLIFTSCTTDSNNSEESNNDMIIGQWRYIGTKSYTVDGDSFTKDANDCISRSTVTFRSNRTITSMNYSPIVTGGCEVNETANNNSENIPWEKISEGKYRIGSSVRDSILFPNANTMEMMSYQNFFDPIEEVEIDQLSQVYTRIE